MAVETTVGGRYALSYVLGRGGMATVYFATDTTLGRPVAVKCLAEHFLDDDGFRRRLVREARIAARLSHPNIVQIYDAGEDDQRPYIVMEYVDGESFAELLRRRGRLPPSEVVDLALQICAGLAHAHVAGLVHRDIKPHNLLLTPSGKVKITDFGIARAEGATQLTQTGTVLGSAGYFAPEQAAGADVTAAADLYSLGAVLYELLSGEKLYQFSSLPELLNKQRLHAIRPLHDLVPGLPTTTEQAVLHCLSSNPHLRPSATELANELTAPITAETATRQLPSRTAAATAAAESSPASIATMPLSTTPSTTRRQPSPPKTSPISQRLAARKNTWIAFALVVAIGLISLTIAIAARNNDSTTPPTRITPIPHAPDTAQQARNLAKWLRQHSR